MSFDRHDTGAAGDSCDETTCDGEGEWDEICGMDDDSLGKTGGMDNDSLVKTDDMGDNSLVETGGGTDDCMCLLNSSHTSM